MSDVRFVKPRDTIEIYLTDNRVLQAKRNTTLEEIFQILPEWKNPPIVGAIVNGHLRELTYPIKMDADVKTLNMSDVDGARIYRRSLTFLLEAAFQDIYPEAKVTIDHAVASGGFYCQVDGMDDFTEEKVLRLENHMREIVKADKKFERKEVPLSDAIDYFKQKQQFDKIRLLKYRRKPHLVLYQLGEQKDYHHGYMVPSSGYLQCFKLIWMSPKAFILQYPRRRTPMMLEKIPENQQLLETFKQYGSWLKRLGVDNVGGLNDAIEENKIREIILVSEAFHEMRIAEIARRISSDSRRLRIVLIAGPSSSGKTTFSKRLSVQLLTQGITPFPLEMDNYFVDRDQTPKDEKGEFDFESIDALNRTLLEEHLSKLINGEQVQLPKFNFKSGKSFPGEIVQLEPDQIILLEGIHGLNPKLLEKIPTERTFRIYISCLTQLNLDRHNRISTTDTRLIRRIVRDARERGYSAYDTIKRWESVGRGEKRHIFPYQDNADEVMNSALVYELSALKPFVEPLLRQVPFGTYEYVEAKRILSFLEWFLPLNTEMIPDNSILQEFLGASILKNFKLWNTNGIDK
ncbi:MAG: nucleoside kinase [Chloroflexi bacterium HGW-Chloroflexi-2]|jgi:uridine kinase|nr:MAG: nucleoside kinase [Chloroflexi bacterium HGW-Chloroflexi-2]